MAAERSLTPLFAPASVAVVGTSNDPRKWGNWLARGAVSGEARAGTPVHALLVSDTEAIALDARVVRANAAHRRWGNRMKWPCTSLCR